MSYPAFVLRFEAAALRQLLAYEAAALAQSDSDDAKIRIAQLRSDAHA